MGSPEGGSVAASVVANVREGRVSYVPVSLVAVLLVFVIFWGAPDLHFQKALRPVGCSNRVRQS